MAVITRERWRVLEPLLDHALDLSSDEQTAWLADLRTTSPELAADLVSLLSGESAADLGGFLLEPLDVPRSDASLAGVELGAYTLERPLGEGGMGSVWLARRTDGRFEGRAAVKLLNLAFVSVRGSVPA
jgi:serine/threonine protein kinase